jgi:hypothetical protein
MQAVLRAEYPGQKGLHVLRSQTGRSPRLVLIANKLWLLRHLRRFASHLQIRLETLRTLADLDSISGLNRYDMVLLLQGESEADDFYTLQCLHLFWGEIPVLLITAHDFHIKPISLPVNVKATLAEALGWRQILIFAVSIYQKTPTPQNFAYQTVSPKMISKKGVLYANLDE